MSSTKENIYIAILKVIRILNGPSYFNYTLFPNAVLYLILNLRILIKQIPNHVQKARGRVFLKRKICLKINSLKSPLNPSINRKSNLTFELMCVVDGRKIHEIHRDPRWVKMGKNLAVRRFGAVHCSLYLTHSFFVYTPLPHHMRKLGRVCRQCSMELMFNLSVYPPTRLQNKGKRNLIILA